MRWSKTFLTAEESRKKVLEFTPQKFDLGIPSPARDYIAKKRAGSDFIMNPATEVTTGVDKVEKITDEERAELRALEKLSQIQESAYREAYQLGLDEGRQKAFEEQSQLIAARLEEFTQLLDTISKIKTELVTQNESHILQICLHMASRIAQAHIQVDDTALLEAIRSAVSLAQDEEKIRVTVSPTQLEFIEQLKMQTGRDFDFLKKIEFSADGSISRGGCIVETNYGEVDSRIEQRIETLWEALRETMPKIKEKLAG
ncbi:MAG: FliH/SctL family protein [Bdellovibrionaceae bacterium]|nr:FliH/SctL family protein [Pseudobdellovibrionaceae bacterium]